MALVHGVFLDLLCDVLDAFVGSELGEEAIVVDGLVVYVQVGDSEVVERSEHLVAQGVLQRNLKGDHVIEEREHVAPVGARGRRRHA